MRIKFFIWLFLSAALYAQSATDILNKVQNKFRAINNFSASFSQIYKQPQGQPGTKVSGKILYEKKNKFNVELNTISIVSDGETIWNYNKKSNRVVISNHEKDPTSFSLEMFIFDYPPMCDTKLIKDENVKNGDKLLELIPKNQKLQFKIIRILVNSDGMISNLEITDYMDIQYIFQFSNIKFNQDISDSKFTFSPPKGIQIIDLR
jgi:chaperone LolA